MKFAFLIMGNFEPRLDHAQIRGGSASFVGVSSIDQACAAAKALQREGVACIELCGAFGPEGAREIIAATGGKIPVGYVTHLPEQDELFIKVFGEEG